MSATPDSLQLESSLGFQRQAWTLQRLGWLLIIGFISVGALGAFGQGPYARLLLTAPNDAFSLRFDRVAREGALTRLDISINASAIHDGAIELRLGKRYLSRVQLLSIVPAPLSSTVAADGVVYRFAALQNARAVQLRIDAEPVHAGAAPIELQLGDGTALEARQYILP